GMSDEGVVVGRGVQPEAVPLGRRRAPVRQRQAGVDLPVACVRGRMQVKQAGRSLVARGRKKDAGAVEEGVGFVQMGASYGKVPGIDDIFDMQRTAAGLALPAVIAGLV